MGMGAGGMKIDERAFRMAVQAGQLMSSAHLADDTMRMVISTYLAALPAEPELEGGVRVFPNSICVHWAANVILRNIPMLNERAAEELTEQVVGAYLDMQRELAAGGRYDPPAEPVVEGRVVLEREENGDEVRG